MILYDLYVFDSLVVSGYVQFRAMVVVMLGYCCFGYYSYHDTLREYIGQSACDDSIAFIHCT
jgi:hypothetical protein